MLKRLVLVFCIGILLTPAFSQAVIIIPTANLRIVINTQGPDDSFHFDLKKNSGIVYEDYAEFDVQTENFTAGVDTFLDLIGNNQFLLTQQLNAGLSASVNCSSDNPASGFVYQTSPVGAAISAIDSSNITCTFNNVPADQKNPVIVVPGMLGTEMFKDQTRLWASILRMLNPLNSDDFMDPLAFNPDLRASDQSVFFGSVVSNPDNLFDYTESLINEFAAQGYVENQDLFTFPYDWRYGITGANSQGLTNVDLLKLKIEEVLAQTGAAEVDVIGHSTGGLLIKKYVMDNPASHRIDKAVFVGVPNSGAPKAIKVLVQGDNFGVYGLSDGEMKKIAQNMPLVYDLAPSEKYFAAKGPYYKVIYENALGINRSEQFLDFDETNNRIIDLFGANSRAIANAQGLHTLAFDNFDLRTAGIDLYNIAGCKGNVISRMVEKRVKPLLGPEFSKFAAPETSLGDGTVPLESATNLPIDESQKFYALEADHGKMPSQNGIRQQIVNLLSGSGLSIDEALITHDFSKCNTKQKAIYIYSPLDVEITDANDPARRLGKAEDGSLQNDIPNAGFYVFGDEKFVFLPADDGRQYEVALSGSAEGSFTLQTQEIDYTGGQQSMGQMAVFANIPVSTALRGQLILDASALQLDNDGNGVIDETLAPSAVLDSAESHDILAPSTTASLAGAEGQSGFYRSEVAVSLAAADAVLTGKEDATSGILRTYYRADEGEWQECGGGNCELFISVEGAHTLSFYSIDRAGNREAGQNLEFTIDQTAPEFAAEFAPATDKFLINAVDKYLDVSVCHARRCIAEDKAGNKSVLDFDVHDQKHTKILRFKSIASGGHQVVFPQNAFRAEYREKKDILKDFVQAITIRNQERVRINYQKKKDQSVIVIKEKGRDKSREVVHGMKFLQLSTSLAALDVNIK